MSQTEHCEPFVPFQLVLLAADDKPLLVNTVCDTCHAVLAASKMS